MATWIRLSGLAAALLVAATFGWFSLLTGDEPAPSELAHGRWREMFWLGVFTMVMATSVVVALRRQRERLQRALIRRRS